MNIELISLIQKRAGNGSVGPSTARSMGPPGTIEAAKIFFYKFNIRSIKARSEASFRQKLDQATEELMKSLPRGGNIGVAHESS